MSIPLLVFAAIYFLLFIAWMVLTLINVYHVMRYAYWTRLPLFIILLYLIFSAGILIATGWLTKDVDWTSSWDVSSSSIDLQTDVDTIRNNLPL
jgi:hypothetical protein